MANERARDKRADLKAQQPAGAEVRSQALHGAGAQAMDAQRSEKPRAYDTVRSRDSLAPEAR